MRLDAGRVSGREVTTEVNRMSDSQDPQNRSPADAMLADAAAGVPVLPLERSGKTPHPMLETREGPSGVYHATTNVERVTYWNGGDPEANLGHACGMGPLSIGVLDLDDWT